ncbi:hypothetical protein [Peribacillus loiseleuriae]|uniref:hypothetical protein n=1 Tax=Peribacillus loiseleuriae TaxID=1679170 RepID=UPI000B0C3BFB|nr:hypothetical protein [Peribacillus loiseleuriae]
MVNHYILKFRSQGIKIAKTKSRHDIYLNLYEVDPGLLDLSTQEVQSSQSKQ